MKGPHYTLILELIQVDTSLTEDQFFRRLAWLFKQWGRARAGRPALANLVGIRPAGPSVLASDEIWPLFDAILERQQRPIPAQPKKEAKA